MALSRARVAVATAMLLVAAAGQILPELPSGCYYTSTIVTLGPGSLTFSSMTIPSSIVTATSTVTVISSGTLNASSSLSTSATTSPILQSTSLLPTRPTGPTSTLRIATSSVSAPSSSSPRFSTLQGASSLDSSVSGGPSSSDILSGISSASGSTGGFPSSPLATTNPSSLTTIVASLPSASTSAGPPPDIQPGDPFFIVVNVGTQISKRALLYVGFDQAGVSFLVSNKADAAVFIIDEAGNLLSGGQFVGTSTDDGTAALQKFNAPPVSSFFWTVDGSTVTFGFASFCVTAADQFFVVFSEEQAQGCSPIEIAAEPGPAASTSMTALPFTTVRTPSSASTVPASSRGVSSLPPGTSPITSFTSSSAPGATSRNDAMSSFSSVLSETSSGVTLSNRTSVSVSSSFSQPTAPSSSSGAMSSAPSSSSSPSNTHATPDSSSTETISSTSPSSSSLSSTCATRSSSSTETISSTSSSSTTASAAVTSSLSAQSSAQTTFSSSLRTSRSTRTSSSSRISCSIRPSPKPSNYPQVPKRGLAYGNVSSLQFYTPPSQISWAYNYYSLPNNSATNNTGPFPPAQNRNMTFYPLLFNDNPTLTSIWEANVNLAVADYGADAIFSFNEPDFCISGSACMTVERALVAYERYIQPFAECGIKLAAPSVTNAANGFVWLSEFLGNATQRNLTVDIINIHWYASPYNQQYFQDYMTEAYRRFDNRPIWITEYGMDQGYQEPAVLQFIRNTTYWVDQQPWIEKACWFGNYVNNLLNADGSGLSPRGQLWNSYVGNGFVYGFNKKRQVVEGDDVMAEASALERPGDLAPPENLAVFKNSQQDDFGDGWLQLVRGELGGD